MPLVSLVATTCIDSFCFYRKLWSSVVSNVNRNVKHGGRRDVGHEAAVTAVAETTAENVADIAAPDPDPVVVVIVLVHAPEIVIVVAHRGLARETEDAGDTGHAHDPDPGQGGQGHAGHDPSPGGTWFLIDWSNCIYMLMWQHAMFSLTVSTKMDIMNECFVDFLNIVFANVFLPRELNVGTYSCSHSKKA